MAQQTNPFDQFDGPATAAGPQVLIPESGTVTAGREVDLNNSRLNGRRTEQQIRIDAENAARAAQAEARQRQALAANMYLKGLRIGANGQPEPIPGWVDPNSAKKPGANGALDSLVGQIKETQRLFREGPGATKGLSGIKDLIPGGINGQFDAAANQLEDQAAMAFKVPGAGGQSDADAARIAAANKPSRWSADGTNEQLFKGLRARVDAMRAAQNLPAAQWDAQTTAAQGQQQNQTPAAMIPGAGTTPQTPSGPEGYNVGTTGGGVSGGSGGGSTFATAAGVAMSKKLSDAYTKGAGVQELNRLLSDNGFQTFSDPATIAAIAKRGRLNFAPPVADDTRGGVGKALGSLADSAGGAYAINAADALTAGTLDNIAGGQSKLAIDYSQQQYPGASLAGTVTGGALAAGGAELGLARAGLGAGAAALGGDALYGAAYGAGSADDGSRVLGALGGGVGGLAGGAAGRGIARGIGGAFRGVQNADAQGLRAAGVPLTVGQTLGGAAKGIEDRLSGVPVLGGIVNARRLEGMQGFNRAAFDEALAPIGANTGGLTQEVGIDAARTARSQAYSDALDPVNLTPDAAYNAEMAAAQAAGQRLPQDMAERAGFALDRVGENVDATGNLSGNGFQQGIRRFRRTTTQNAPLPNGDDLGDVMRQGEGALEGLLQRQSPATLQAYNAANAANRNVEVLRNAVNRARNGTRVGETGTFAPSQLSDAAAANAKKFGNSQGTTRQPFFGLSRAGQAVLPNSVPDSGTAGRLFTQQALGAAGLGVLGGGAGYAGGGEDSAQTLGLGGLATGALLAAGGSRAAQRALVASLIDRPQVAIRLGTGIANRARIGGLFGAPMLAGAGSQLATQ